MAVTPFPKLPFVNIRGQRCSHIRLVSDSAEFTQNTSITAITGMMGATALTFGHKIVNGVDTANQVLVLRLRGTYTGGYGGIPPAGALTITFSGGPTGPTQMNVQYVDDPEDTPDDP